MPTGYEVGLYRDIAALRHAMEEQAVATARLAAAVEGIVDGIVDTIKTIAAATSDLASAVREP